MCSLYVCSAAAQEYRIGFITDLSGPGSYLGAPALRGATLAVEDLQRAGISAKLIVEDHAMDPARALSAAQKLIQLNHVDMLYSEFSAPSVAVSAASKNARLLMLYDAGAASPVRDNPFAFKLFLDFEEGCALLARHLKDRGVGRLGMLKVSVEAGELCSAGAKTVFPDLTELPFNRGESIAAQVFMLKRKGAEVVFNVAYEGDLVNMFKEMIRLHYLPWIGTLRETWLALEAQRNLPPSGLRGVTYGFKRQPAEFIAALQKRFPGSDAKIGIDHAALAYVHLRQAGAALKACARGDSACQVQKLAQAGSEAAFGFHRWDDRAARYEITVQEHGGD